ncbi:POK25 protein, partial [Syrrhaptes paradoxus]|nr:POK25 protein [Syrrhaptes paradoxus]
RGLLPLQRWQTDVTEYPSFGRLRYTHVSVDTCSSSFWATLHVSTTAKDIRKHLTICFAVMGVPAKIKTDNGPGYRSSALAAFLQQWGVTHDFGVP